MEKRILKEMAKRWCKGVIESSEIMMSFDDSGLTIEEMEYLEEEVMKVASRITSKDSATNTHSLVKEYYEFG